MKLWLISQTINTDYDTYDSAVVAAETEEEARRTYPSGSPDKGWPDKLGMFPDWALPADVTAVEIGTAKEGTKPGVIIASFNAG